MTTCEFCGASTEGTLALKTGVSAYIACRDCLEKWGNSDHTYEALQELRAMGSVSGGKG